jgi:hypothetical protein
MILIAILLAVLMLKKFKAISFALVVAWALWGIKASQGSIYPLIESITTVSIACLFVMIVITLIKRDPKII